MRVVSDLPRPVRDARARVDPARRRRAGWAPGSGCPRTPRQHPVPAILEYLPYRKGDGTADRATPRATPSSPATATPAVRVDIRGSGDSDGVLLDEYQPQEQHDGVEVLRWLAAQPLVHRRRRDDRASRGAASTACRSPPAPAGAEGRSSRSAPPTTATPTTCTTCGGCRWPSTCCSWALRRCCRTTPCRPTRQIVGDGWRDALARAARREPPFVRHVARAPAPRRLLAAGLGVRGLRRRSSAPCTPSAAGTTATPTRSCACSTACSCPRKGLIGPWEHTCPEEGDAGPAIGFLQECLRLWDHWLKGEDTGVHGRPDAARLDAGPAWRRAARYPERPGRWVAEDAWPSAASRRGGCALGGRAAARRAPDGTRPQPQHRRGPAVRADAGAWCPTATRPTSRPTSAPRTAARCASRRRRWRARWTARHPAAALELAATGRVALVCAGSATWRPTARPPWSPAACSTSATATARAPGAARARATLPVTSSSRRSATRSPPGTGCAWRSRPRTGRGSGRRPSPSR